MDTSTDLELGHDIDQDDEPPTLEAVEPTLATTTREYHTVTTTEKHVDRPRIRVTADLNEGANGRRIVLGDVVEFVQDDGTAIDLSNITRSWHLESVAGAPRTLTLTFYDFEIVTLEQMRLAAELAANRAIDLGLELTTADLTAFAHRHLGEPDATATG